MRLAHLADLHIGKKFGELSLLEDQQHILSQIIEIITAEQVDVVLISGDIYDKAQPSAQAVTMLDDFLASLSARGLTVLIIAGNHDAPARVSYGKEIFARQNIYLAGKLEGLPEVVSLSDEFGKVNFVLLPFFRLYEVKNLFPEENINSYNEAVSFLLNALNLPSDERKVLLSHQYYSWLDEALLSDSEMDIVGGLDVISADVLQGFTYAALGHLHRPQKLLKDNIRYAGSPLSYSFSEADQSKSVPIIDLDASLASASVHCVELKPLRKVREISGTLHELLEAARNESQDKLQDILHIRIEDKERLINPMGKLESYYPNIVQLEFARDLQSLGKNVSLGDIKNKTSVDLFADFYKEQLGFELKAADQARIVSLWQEMQSEQERQARG